MSRCGTFLRLAAVIALALLSTACFKFTPEVTSLSSGGTTGGSYKPNGYFSAFSGRSSTSPGGYNLRGSLDRTSEISSVSGSAYTNKISPIAKSQMNGSSL